MQLVLTEENLRFAWGSTTEYWFSRTDYTIHKSSDLPCEDYACLVEMGFIPFITISNEEVIRAYIKSLNNPKVESKFDNLSSYDCVEMFWKYFNAYKDISAGFDAFESKYVMDKVTGWCEENGINYKIAEQE
ncbi:MAG TPA: hypothetical protein IAA24_03110 [Candidatus Eubacterium faecigallinarum]|nr:hypothetical protein [Candidatus Eubacterium faecigallinarum]